MIGRLGRVALGGGVALALALQPACSSGGGGGGGSPTQPPPPAATTVNAAGSVRGMFDGRASFSGSTIEVAGAAGEIQGDNSFSLQNLASGDHVATFSGSSHFERKVRLRLQGAGTIFFSDLELVEMAGFNLAAFDEIYRESDGGTTMRWTQRPVFVVDRGSFDNANQHRMVRGAIRNTLSDLARGFFADPQIEDRRVTGESCLDMGPSEIGIRASDDIPCENCIGAAQPCVFQDGSISRVMVWLAHSVPRAVTEHELFHAIGASGHLEHSSGQSIMVPRLGQGVVVTGMDRKHLFYLYGRPPGTRSPDDMSQLGPIIGSSESGGQSRFEPGPSGSLRVLRPIE